MRFLITLLALITGFSAADAARPHGAEPHASVALAAEAVAASVDNVVSMAATASRFVPLAQYHCAIALQYALPVASSPVTRADLLRE